MGYHRDQDSQVITHPDFRLPNLREEGDVSPEEIEALRMESSTWALLKIVMPCANSTLAPVQIHIEPTYTFFYSAR